MWEDEVLPGPDYLMNWVQYLHQLQFSGSLWLKEQKKGLHVLRCPVFYRKYRWSSGIARNFKKGAIISTLFDCLFIRQSYFKADWETRKVLGGVRRNAPPEKIWKFACCNFQIIFTQIWFNFLTLIMRVSPNTVWCILFAHVRLCLPKA